MCGHLEKKSILRDYFVVSVAKTAKIIIDKNKIDGKKIQSFFIIIFASGQIFGRIK